MHTVPVMNIHRVYVGITQQLLVTVYFELKKFKKGGGTVTQMRESFLYWLFYCPKPQWELVFKKGAVSIKL